MTSDTLKQKPDGQLTFTNPKTDHDAATGLEQGNKIRRKKPKALMFSMVAVVLIAFVFVFIISRTPSLFDVQATVEKNTSDTQISGVTTTSVLIRLVDTLLHKPGGYLSNDVIPPTILLDNMPSWEFGALTEIRDVVRAMRNDFSRIKSQSTEDNDLSKADAQFHFDHTHWILPATEDEFRQGQAALERYLSRLQSGEVRFFARADNLSFYLATAEKRLGSLSQRLSESVREPFLRELISGSENTSGVQNINPWLEIDNVFFEARGYAWALLHVLKAIEVDFATVLQGKDATLLLRQVIKSLENTQHALFSPMVLNSTGFGMLTNHSLVMASYISRANAALIDLRAQLEQG